MTDSHPRSASAGLGSSLVGALDALVVSVALMIGLPRLTDGNEVLLIFLVLIAAVGIFLLVKAAIGAVLSRSRTRRNAVLGAAVLVANLASAAIGMAGLDRATLQ